MTTALRFPIEEESAQEHARHIVMFCGALLAIAPVEEQELIRAIERRAWRIVHQLEQT